jgi:hypothetical protein
MFFLEDKGSYRGGTQVLCNLEAFKLLECAEEIKALIGALWYAFGLTVERQ